MTTRGRNREYERKRRERIENQPEKKVEEQNYERKRWRKMGCKNKTNM